MLSDLSRGVILGRWPLLLIAVSLAAAGYMLNKHLTYDHSIERMFVRNDPVLKAYASLKEYLGGNEIVLAVYEDDSLLADDGSGIRRLEEIAQRLREVDGVQDVLSLAQVNAALFHLYEASRVANSLANSLSIKPDESNAKGTSAPPDLQIDFPLTNPKDKLGASFCKFFKVIRIARMENLRRLPVCSNPTNGRTSRAERPSPACAGL